MRQKLRIRWKALKMEIKEHKSSFVVYMVLRALVILVMILQILNRNYEDVFYCVLTLLLLIVPSFLQVELKIELPTTLEIIILLFIFSAEILGGDRCILYARSQLGYNASYFEWIFSSRNWFFVSRYS